MKKEVTRDLCRRYNDLDRQIKALKKEKETIREIIIADGVRDYPFADFCVKVSKRTTNGVDMDALRERYPDIVKELAKQTISLVINIRGC